MGQTNSKQHNGGGLRQSLKSEENGSIGSRYCPRAEVREEKGMCNTQIVSNQGSNQVEVFSSYVARCIS